MKLFRLADSVFGHFLVRKISFILYNTKFSPLKQRRISDTKQYYFISHLGSFQKQENREMAGVREKQNKNSRLPISELR